MKIMELSVSCNPLESTRVKFLLLLSPIVGFVLLIAVCEPEYRMLRFPSSWLLACAAALIKPALGQFPPAPDGVTILDSKFDENIKISYKEVCSQIFLEF